MSRLRRSLQDSGWVLHRRPYRDSSLLLEVFTPVHGRVGVVARGARSPRSRARGLLQPFMPLSLALTGSGELLTLTGVESQRPAHALTGDALLAGFYLNELLLRLLAREDPLPALWSDYAQTLERLAAGEIAPALRGFELALLEALGYGLNLDRDIVDGSPLEPDAQYEYVLEAGPRRLSGVMEGAALCFPGSVLIGLREGRLPTSAARRDARLLLGACLQIYLGGRPLHSREVLRSMRRFAGGRAPTTEGGES